MPANDHTPNMTLVSPPETPEGPPPVQRYAINGGQGEDGRAYVEVVDNLAVAGMRFTPTEAVAIGLALVQGGYEMQNAMLRAANRELAMKSSLVLPRS